MATIISSILLIALIIVPILLFVGIRKWISLKFDFWTYLIFGLIITAGIMWTFVWWGDYSNRLLMSHYGYDFDAMNDNRRFVNVEPENFERVKQLEIGYFGVGWPLKAIMTFVFYSPYLLIVYLVGQLIGRTKRK
ncbi:hypothetical protein AWW67_08245 [Roseivirga seohaensis]|uniref:Uncharacterized protein n=1 Tax=Roseivirga seohaensis TaxID=1914963 RepID=A0A150XRL3_9BACT|nr:hypothetical protein [Roseivirga seohaensis]KYG81334.1 hypothetical protein AWW67_08245 [Roseivirga seohaensis]